MAATNHLRVDRRLMAAFGVVSFVAFAALGWRVDSAAAPRHKNVDLTATTGADGQLDLTFAGDTMLGDGADALIKAKGSAAILEQVKPLLTGDVVLINAEGPITRTAQPANPGAKYSYAVDPDALAALRAIGVDGLNLGNNHAMDRGTAGLADTRAFAAADGMVTVGAGANRNDAESPLIIRAPDVTVGVVSLGENFGPLHRSTETTAGMVPFSIDRIQRGLLLAKAAGADKVVAFVHWGDNYDDVNQSQAYWASVFADAGYDAVIGSGSHTLQPVTRIKGMPVVFGMGNFVFGAPGRFAAYGKQGLGAVVNLHWSPAGAGQLSFDCIQTDNLLVGFVPRPCPPAQLASARTILGPEVTWTGDQGVLQF